MFCLGGESAEASSQRRLPRKLPHKAIQVVCFSVDGKRVATCTRSLLAVWDLERNEQVVELEHSGMDCLEFCNSLGTVLVGGGPTGITVFELSPSPPSSTALRRPAGCLALDVSREGAGVFGLTNGALQLFHRDAPGVVIGTMRDQGAVCSVSLNRAGTVLVSCTDKTRYSRWDTSTLQLVQRVQHQTWVWACLSDSLGSRFISCEGRHSCTLRLWDAIATESVVLPTQNHSFEAYAVSADFSRLVFVCTAGGGGRLVMLCVGTGEWSEVHCFPVGVQDVCLSPTTSQCAVGLANGLTFVLDLGVRDKHRILALVAALDHALPTEILRLVKWLLCWKGGGGG